MKQQSPIVLVGDTILDRIAKPLPRTLRRRKSYVASSRPWLGGVWNSARAIESLGFPVHVVTALPSNVRETDAASLLRRPDSSLLLLDSFDTAVERIWITIENELIQVNYGDRYEIEIPKSWSSVRLPTGRATLVQDYGHGVVQAALEQLTSIAGTVVWDPHAKGAIPAPGCFTTANLSYYDAAKEPQDSQGLKTLRTTIRELASTTVELDLRAAIATIGHGGLLGHSRTEGSFFNPAILYETQKVVGAGDIFTAALTAALIETDGLRSAARTAANNSARLIRDGDITLGLRGPNDETIEREENVATGGCFDLLHSGHIALLAACRQLGKHFTVLLNSDSSVRTLKGNGRPIQSAVERIRQLRDTGLVDDILVFDDPTPTARLKELKPDLFVKGSDYISFDIPEAELLEAWGGKVLTVPIVPGISTSAIISHLRETIEA
jgi:D-beta-D-heptose 7-phosphate kinase/D-beta-D-heptose 1-phosphate adenosyltransferase